MLYFWGREEALWYNSKSPDEFQINLNAQLRIPLEHLLHMNKCFIATLLLKLQKHAAVW